MQGDGPRNITGYSAPGRENVRHNQVLEEASDPKTIGEGVRNISRDVKESFEVGKEDDADMPNIWFPDDVFPGFRETCLDFYWVSAIGMNCRLLII